MNRLLAIASLVVLSATLYINFLAGTGGINNIGTGEVSGMYPTLFTPAGFTFAIWSVIYLLNTAFVVTNLYLAFRKPGCFQAPLIKLFIGICLVNIAWIFAWHYDNILVSVFIMLAILAQLIAAFVTVQSSEEKGFSVALAKINFGVYLGWISVATIANLSAQLSGKAQTDWGQTDVLWTWIVMATAVALAIFLLMRFKSFAYALVIAWAFYGIYSARTGQLSEVEFQVADAALVGIALVLLTSGYVFTRKMLSLRSSSTKPSNAA